MDRMRLRRRAVLRAAGALLALGFASGGFAMPPLARMDDDDRQQLRQELRQQERARARAQRLQPQGGGEAGAGQWGPPRGAHRQPMPPQWQGQPEQWQGHPGPAFRQREGANERQRLSPEERQQLREQLRERQGGSRR
ncbi:MAG: hypothetical protein KJZ83_23155 [Burkholderiaceae bacterium]|nr:hypothetical protein [Burkholderiaceae bacterium]